MAAETQETPKAAAAFKKADILASEKYRDYTDILSTELDGEKGYNADEIKDIIKTALSREVKEEVNP